MPATTSLPSPVPTPGAKAVYPPGGRCARALARLLLLLELPSTCVAEEEGYEPEPEPKPDVGPEPVVRIVAGPRDVVRYSEGSCAQPTVSSQIGSE